MGQLLKAKLMKSYCINIFKVGKLGSPLGYLESILPELERIHSLPISTGDRTTWVQMSCVALSDLLYVS